MEDPSSQDLLLQFVLLVVLTFLNAFFFCYRDGYGFS